MKFVISPKSVKKGRDFVVSKSISSDYLRKQVARLQAVAKILPQKDISTAIMHAIADIHSLSVHKDSFPIITKLNNIQQMISHERDYAGQNSRIVLRRAMKSVNGIIDLIPSDTAPKPIRWTRISRPARVNRDRYIRKIRTGPMKIISIDIPKELIHDTDNSVKVNFDAKIPDHDKAEILAALQKLAGNL